MLNTIEVKSAIKYRFDTGDGTPVECEAYVLRKFDDLPDTFDGLCVLAGMQTDGIEVEVTLTEEALRDALRLIESERTKENLNKQSSCNIANCIICAAK